MTREDSPLVFCWLSKKHVKRWWNDGDDTLEKVVKHYGNTSDEVKRFVLIEAGNAVEKPIGYFQYYFVSDNVIGIDQFIGEEDYINRGVGRKTIEMFIDLIKQRHAPAAIILDPSPDNKRAVKCYEAVGFKHYETVENEKGQTAYMMRFEISKRL